MNQRYQRRIIHVDMDAFYASVEQRDAPSLQGKPVIVGGRPESRGVVSTASYEARKFGVHSAMPLAEAKRLCPEASFLPVNFRKYCEVSLKIREIFLTYTPMMEPLSLDEAFLDVSGSTSLFGSSEQIALTIKERIQKELNLTASVGIAYNKFLAKLASDLKKPNGFVVVPSNGVQAFLDPLPVERVWGVGKKIAEHLHGLNIRTVRDLRQLDINLLSKRFGVLGTQLYELARGIDDRPVESEREAKSVGRETTFASDISDPTLLETTLLELACDIGQTLRKRNLKGRTITLKARYNDFHTLSRSHTLSDGTNLDDVIFKEATQLLRGVSLKQPLRLIGISLHQLSTEALGQLSIFDEFTESNQGKEKLAQVTDAIKAKYGEHIITRARLLKRTSEDLENSR